MVKYFAGLVNTVLLLLFLQLITENLDIVIFSFDLLPVLSEGAVNVA